MLEFFTISMIIMLAAISPGPDFALVSRNSLKYSGKTGTMTALGTAIGILFHASYCVLGFAVIISQSLLLFNIIKYIGAGYLIYLGIKGLREKRSELPEMSVQTKENDLSSFRAFTQGLLCNALNPKAIFFFLAFFTMVIRPSMPISLQIFYCFEVSLIHFIWFSMVAMFFSHDRVKLFLGDVLHYVTKAFGGLLVLFGLKIATFSHER